MTRYYLNQVKGKMTAGVALKFVGSLSDLIIPSLIAVVIDIVLPQEDTGMLMTYAGLMLLLMLSSVICNRNSNYLAVMCSGTITKNMRSDLMSKISCLSRTELDKIDNSSLITRITSDTYIVNSFISSLLRLGIRAPIMLIGGLCVTMMMDWALTLILALTVPAVAIIAIVISKYSIPIFARTQECLENVIKITRENATGVRIIRSLSKSEYEIDRYEKANAQMSQFEQKGSIVMSASQPITTFILNIGLFAAVFFGARRINAGTMAIGELVAFSTTYTMILNATISISRIFIDSTKGITSANRIYSILRSDNEMECLPIEKESSDSQIVFDNVSFSYNGKVNNVSGIDFSIAKGETLGIIGATGSGKSTIIKLLLRFYDCQAGKILINGQDIRAISESNHRKVFGSVFQNDFIINDTILANIRYGRDISEQQVEQALRLAQANFVFDYKDAIYHKLDINGANLSGGQKQRIYIARAIACNPQILLLDDCTSALDYITESAIKEQLNSMVDTTKIIITQRISSIYLADKIIIMDKGRIAALGKHEELLKTSEIYRDIFEYQTMDIDKEVGNE